MFLTSISQNYYMKIFMKIHRYYLYRIGHLMRQYNIYSYLRSNQEISSNIPHSHNNHIHYISIGAMVYKIPPFTSLHP